MDDIEKTIWHLFYDTPIFVHHFKAIEFKIIMVWKCSIWAKIGVFLFHVTLKFDTWLWKTMGYLFYAIISFLHQFIVIGEFKMQLQSGNAPFRSKLASPSFSVYSCISLANEIIAIIMKKPHSSSQILLKFVMWSESECAVMIVRSFPGSYNCCNCLSMETPWAHYRLLMSIHGPTESLAESVLQYPSHRKGCEIFRQSCQLYLTNRHHIET